MVQSPAPPHLWYHKSPLRAPRTPQGARRFICPSTPRNCCDPHTSFTLVFPFPSRGRSRLPLFAPGGFAGRCFLILKGPISSFSTLFVWSSTSVSPFVFAGSTSGCRCWRKGQTAGRWGLAGLGCRTLPKPDHPPCKANFFPLQLCRNPRNGWAALL